MEEIVFKSVNPNNDLELILSWRSNPEIYEYFPSQNGPIKWREHLDFWTSRKDCVDLIIHYQERKIGLVSISNIKSKTPEIGLVIGFENFMG